jgi:asparagine synthase (glutamine-hydrolysing)
MCGLFAAFSVPGAAIGALPLRAALARMRPRGPDGEGVWQEDGVVLGHRRLAILDLDERAGQPMHSHCGRYVLVFNGEIYNFAALRRELEATGAAFRTSSDSEVLLHLFAREGPAMLPKLHGMFAFVIWDRLRRQGFAARDPYGIKPLYLAATDAGLLVGSQVRSLLATGLVSRAPCPQGQAGFWMLGSVPEPRSWFRDIESLPAGGFAWVREGRLAESGRWADIGGAWRRAAEADPPDPARVMEGVRAAIRESVRRHLVSDVPVGAFLSGGIDSGTLAALISQFSPQRLTGVTLAFEEFAGRPEDETGPARAIADQYGIQHRVRRISRSEFEADLPAIMEAMDQPSIDGVNTWYASKAAAEQGLKVVVSGVGGDELFQGYAHFRDLPRLRRVRQLTDWIPGCAWALRQAGRYQADRTGNPRWRRLEDWTRTLEGAWWLRKSLHTPDELPALMGPDLADEALKGFDVQQAVQNMTGPLSHDPMLAIGQIDSCTYLRNQLLRDSDWASMAHSIELRTPLVDAHLLEQLEPYLLAFRHHPGKSLLAGTPERPMNAALLSRRKTGFGIPVARWLAGRDTHLAQAWAPRLVAEYEASER